MAIIRQELVGPDWAAWKIHPQTKAFRLLLAQTVQEQQDCWFNGDFLSEDWQKAAMLNAAAIATAQLAAKMCNLIDEITASEEENA